MKLLLINPTIDGAGELYHPGLASLATYLNYQTAHEARVLDFVFHEWEWKDYLKRKLELIKPDLVGITATTPKMPAILQIAREVKSLGNYPIILGGHHPSLESEETLAIPEVDYIAIGESEFYLEQLLDHLAVGKSMEGVQGIWAKENGQIIRNELGQLPTREELDDMPDCDWDLWEDIDHMIYMTGYIPMMAVRGCAYDCTFCSSPFLRKRLEGTGPFVRGRSPEVCARECLNQYNKYKKRGLRWLFFYDLNFLVNRRWLIDFCKEYIRLGLHKKLPFSVYSRLDHLTDEKVAWIKKAGCIQIRVGIESGNEAIRNKYFDKELTNQQITDGINILHRHKVPSLGYFIVGAPGETKETIHETFKFARELNLTRYAFFMFKPLAHTSATISIEEMNAMIDYNAISESQSFYSGVVVKLPGIPSWKLLLWYKTNLFRSGFRIMFRQIDRLGPRWLVNFVPYLIKGKLRRSRLFNICMNYVAFGGDNFRY